MEKFLQANRSASPIRRLLLAALVAALLAAYLSCFRNALIDDAYITLQYARTLRDHGVWGFYPDEPLNTATSPLNVVVVAAVGLAVRDMPSAAIAAGVIECLAILALLLLLSRRLFGSDGFAVAGFSLLLANPLLLSTLGMETLLYVALMLLSLYLFTARRPLALAGSLALLTLTRPDGVILFIVLFFLYGRRRWMLLPPYILFLVPWYQFAWRFLGSAVPDTLLIKLSGKSWDGHGFATGPMLYLRRYPAATALSFAALALFPLALRIRGAKPRSLLGALVLFGSLYYLAYSLLGVPPYHWYYAPLVAVLVIIGALGLSSVRWGPWAGLIPATAMVALLFRQPLPLSQPPIHTNWATSAQYREIGIWISEHVPPETRIKLQGEIGTLAFYSTPHLCDVFSSRAEQAPTLRRLLAVGGELGAAASANYAYLQLPEGEPVYSLRLIGSWDVESLDLPDRGVLKVWDTSTSWAPRAALALVAN